MTEEKRYGGGDWLSRLSHGDIDVEAWVRDDGAVARTGDGLIEVVVNTTASDQTGLDRLRQGVAIFVNGERVGQLRQPTNGGLRRSSRAVLLEWDSPEQFPQEAYFVARGVRGYPSLETKNERICTRDWFGHRKIDPRADAELLALWLLVEYGLAEAVQV